MNDKLLDLLIKLQSDKSVVVYLYEELFKSSYFTLVERNSGSELQSKKFLTYDSQDGVRELPIFSKEEFIFEFPIDSESFNIPGCILWSRLLEIIETGNLEVAIDPGQSHGIRMNNQMILGMISRYGDKLSTQ